MLEQIKHGSFVAFVGAGASVIPPSLLPSWSQFNDLLLQCLCERVSEYSRQRQPATEILATFRADRDSGQFFAPDFQAQLMEEEIGAEYFKVWQSLDTDAYSPVHASLAGLAAGGHLHAVITTNFDRLIERALAARGVEYEVFHNAARFDQLALQTTQALPILKIHGSIEDASSLIDTLKQRVVGRPESLLQAIRKLLHQSPWLYLGFSGADFSYDPHYLGILDAAAEARGFVFLARPGTNVNPGILDLQRAYGPAKSEILQGDLSTWVSETFGLPSLQTLPASDPPPVKRRIAEWVARLGDISVINILCSMLKSCGLEAESHWLLRKTFKSYRSGEDTRSLTYSRFNYNYGLSLLEKGFIVNPVALEDDRSNLTEWKYADQNAFEFLARAYREGNLLAAGGALASLLALRGEVGRGIDLASEATEEAIAKGARADQCDIAISSVTIYDLMRLIRPAVAQMLTCLDLSRRLGDEPRRAMICAHLSRLFTSAKDFEEADKFLTEADRVARRLGLRSVLLYTLAARGLRLTETDPLRALEVLQHVLDVLHAQDDVPLYTSVDLADPNHSQMAVKGKHPLLCRALLDLNAAALIVGNSDALNESLNELDEITTRIFLGYCPHYYLSYAESLILSGEREHKPLILDLLRRARELGTAGHNPWVKQATDQLEQKLSAAN